MRRSHSLLLILVLAVCLPLSACGKSPDDAATGFSFGACEYMIPYLPTTPSEALDIGFKNLTSSTATVTATAYTSFGVMYTSPVPVVIPPLGEVRLPASTFTGPTLFGGWLDVDTTGTAKGLVVVYADRTIAGTKRSAAKAATYRPGTIYSALSPFSTSYQVINHSKTAGGVPTAATYDITMYDPFGDVVSSTPGVAFAASETMTFPVSLGTVGMVSVTPVAPLPADPLTLVTVREDVLPVHSEYRFRHEKDTRLTAVPYAFDLEFGRDAPGAGNVNDFGVMLSNPTSSLETLIINGIYRANGTTILGVPQFVSIEPHSTKFLATRTIDSYGLDLAGGETSPFEALFGDVSAAGSVTSFSMLVTASADVNVSARHYDSLFSTYCRIVSPRRLTTAVNVSNMPIQTTTAGAIRTYVDFMNPTGFDQTVFVRGFTPGGTEYVLDSFVLGPNRRVRWSQDGTIFREDPFDLLLPPVGFMSFEFSATGGIHVGARTEIRDVIGIFTDQVPIIVRNLAFE